MIDDREAAGSSLGQRRRVLLFSPQLAFVQALAARLEREPDIEVVAAATAATEAELDTAAPHADVVVLDADAGPAALDCVRGVAARTPPLEVVLLVSAAGTGELVGSLFPEAVVVAKEATATVLLEAIRRRSGAPESGSFELDGAGVGAGGAAPDELARTRLATLTPREREILGLLVEGLGRAAIAERLFVSQHTVRTHVQRLLAKLDVHSSLEAVAVALRTGMRPDP